MGTHNTMEFTALVTDGLSTRLQLACAEDTEVLGCLWGDVGEKFHLNAAQGLSWLHVSILS